VEVKICPKWNQCAAQNSTNIASRTLKMLLEASRRQLFAKMPDCHETTRFIMFWPLLPWRVPVLLRLEQNIMQKNLHRGVQRTAQKLTQKSHPKCFSMLPKRGADSRPVLLGYCSNLVQHPSKLGKPNPVEILKIIQNHALQPPLQIMHIAIDKSTLRSILWRSTLHQLSKPGPASSASPDQHKFIK